MSARHGLAEEIGNKFLQADIELLGERAGDVDDDVFAIIALEHYGRFEAMLKAVRDDHMARNLFIFMARRALNDAQELQDKINAQPSS